MTKDPVAAGCAVLGSTLPDAIEGLRSLRTKEDYIAWNRIHRKQSHWFVPYLVLLCLSWSFSLFPNFLLSDLLPIHVIKFYKSDLTNLFFLKTGTLLFGWYLVGVLMHILEDAICGKVPFANPNKKDFGIRLFKTGSFTEYCLSWLLVLFAIGLYSGIFDRIFRRLF